MTPQKSFGEFTSDRFGPNWVYGRSKNQESFSRDGRRQTVITKSEQAQLTADYKAAWGREYDPEFWAMLCALRAIHEHAANRDNCPATIEALAAGALQVAGVSA